MSGVLVAIEGGDAAGKATQAAMLAQRLGSKVFSFPRYETPLGEIIRGFLRGDLRLSRRDGTAVEGLMAHMVLQSMMTADKAEGTEEICHRLSRNEHVVLDRWWPSALVYGSADGIPSDWLERLGGVLPRPHVSILIDVPVEAAIARRPVPDDRYEADLALRRDVHERYRRLWERMDARRGLSFEPRWPSVSGVGSVEAVAARIWEHVEPEVGRQEAIVRGRAR